MKLEEVLNRENFTNKDLKKLVDDVFALKKQELGLANVRLVYAKNPFKSYGSINFGGNFNNIVININLYKFRIRKQNKLKKIFNIYNTLIHELEHIKTFQKTNGEDYYDYEHLMILLEYFRCAKIFNIDIGKRKINLISKINIKRLMDINYPISTSEIKSRLIAYRETLDVFYPCLKEEDIKTYKKIILSLEYLSDNIEIMYDRNRRPINKFLTIIRDAYIFVVNNKNLIQEFGILKNLFNDDGTIKNIYDLYQSINDKNKEMYDKLIINLFLSINVDLTPYFGDVEFKKYMEGLIDKYNNKVVDFFKNIEIAKVFIDDNKILRDNLMMQKQSVLLLDRLTNFYGLQKNSGIVLDYSLRKDFKIGNSDK